MVNPSSRALADFPAGLWVPSDGSRLCARGFATVRVTLFPGRLVVTPRFKQDALNFALGIPDSIEYRWPAIVVERLRPMQSTHALIELDGKLGAVAVGPLSGNRFREALRAAGFAVIERARWGWEAPRPVAEADVPGNGDRLPTCTTTR